MGQKYEERLKQENLPNWTGNMAAGCKQPTEEDKL